MKTDIKQLLKDLKTNDLEFVDPTDAKLLNKDKEYHLHNGYQVGITNFTYSYPCLVELVIGDSKVFNLKRTTAIEQNLQKPVGVEAPIQTTTITKNTETTTVIPSKKEVNTNIVSDAAARALIGDFIEKNT